MEEKLRVLAIAVRTGRVGYVFLVDGELSDWRLSKKASKSNNNAAEHAKMWITNLKPDVVVTEKVAKHGTKSRTTRQRIDAIAKVAAKIKLLDVSVPRVSLFKNKYEEAASLGIRFPEIAAWVPKKPRLWETEPRNTVYFEALVLALQVINTSEPHSAYRAGQHLAVVRS